MSTDMAINPWTIRASHAPLEVHASHFSTLRTSVNPTLDAPNPPPSTGWSQLSVISSFHHQKFQTKPGHMIIYLYKAVPASKKNTIWDTWSEWISKVSENDLEPICSWTTSSVTCILPGTYEIWESRRHREIHFHQKALRTFGQLGGVWKEVSQTKNIWEFKVMISS